MAGKAPALIADHPTTSAMDEPSARSIVDYLDQRFEENERIRQARYEPKWRRATELIIPNEVQWEYSDTERNDQDRSSILDETATWALSVASAGLLHGMASPARPWIELGLAGKSGTRDEALWLRKLRDAVLRAFRTSNYYQELEVMFRAEMVVASAPLGIFEDMSPGGVIRCEVPAIGSWAIANDPTGMPVVFQEEIVMSARQVEQRWGREMMSYDAQQLLRTTPGAKVHVRRMVMPNPDYLPGSLVNTRMRYVEYYWEHDRGYPRGNSGTPHNPDNRIASGTSRKPLSESGYSSFPYAVAHWRRNLGDTYGTGCPGFDALGSIGQLQVQEDRALLGIEKAVEPPMITDPGLDASELSLVPGEATMAAEGGGTGAHAAHEVNINFQHLEAKSAQVRERIERAFMVPIFLSLIADERNQRATATEVDEIVRERFQVLGPTLQRHSIDVFEPTIQRTIEIILRKSEPMWERGEEGLVPPPPESLGNVFDLEIEYISEVALAQRGQGLLGMERFMTTAMNTAQALPEVLDRVDADEFMEQYGHGLGIAPSLIRPLEEAQDDRMQRQQAAEAAAAQEAAPAVAGAAKQLSETQVQGESALDRLVSASGI
jgi:hypothetical protein